MPVTNTDELQALVKDWLNRDDLDAALNTFVLAADERILADPRSRGEMTEQVIVLDRNESLEMVNPVPITTRYYAEWDGFYADGFDTDLDAQPDEEQLTEDTYDYEYLNVYVDDVEYTRVSINEFYSDNRKDQQDTYTVIGGRLYIKGFPDVDPAFTGGAQAEQEPYVLRLVVFKKQPLVFPDPVTDEAGNVIEAEEGGTSELLRSIPMAYLYASLVEAAIYLRDQEGLMMYQARYEEFMEKLYKDYKRKQVSSGWAVKSVGGDKLFNTRRA